LTEPETDPEPVPSDDFLMLPRLDDPALHDATFDFLAIYLALRGMIFPEPAIIPSKEPMPTPAPSPGREPPPGLVPAPGF
jgi:hypothetical protein